MSGFFPHGQPAFSAAAEGFNLEKRPGFERLMSAAKGSGPLLPFFFLTFIFISSPGFRKGFLPDILELPHYSARGIDLRPRLSSWRVIYFGSFPSTLIQLNINRSIGNVNGGNIRTNSNCSIRVSTACRIGITCSIARLGTVARL